MLQNLGFKNTKFLYGGTKALADYLNPKTAPAL